MTLTAHSPVSASVGVARTDLARAGRGPGPGVVGQRSCAVGRASTTQIIRSTLGATHRHGNALPSHRLASPCIIPFPSLRPERPATRFLWDCECLWAAATIYSLVVRMLVYPSKML
ncbi:hypothetical protein EVAR_99602_1 [Eumeta japonica]|uniref:Uncharacterized protein n=1 Tax=Eumeta variegata TaxID=151549 RepID=A0A4C1ZXU9_EUMVA|nr:hypothetical protein EVAR_99602_1 [Eumeta japonica]